MWLSPVAIPANGTSQSLITVQLKDAFGNNVPTGGATVIITASKGTISSVTDNGNGTYAASVTSSLIGEVSNVTYTLNSVCWYKFSYGNI